jgi:hypothetical protein
MADFNNDGKTDIVVTYGPIVGNQNTQVGLITYVNGNVRTFADSVGLQFKIQDYNDDGVDDLGLWLGTPSVWRHLIWSSDAWTEFQ